MPNRHKISFLNIASASLYSWGNKPKHVKAKKNFFGIRSGAYCNIYLKIVYYLIFIHLTQNLGTFHSIFQNMSKSFLEI